MYIIILIIIVLAFSLLLFLPIKFNIIYHQEKGHFDLKFIISFISIIIFRKKISKKKLYAKDILSRLISKKSMSKQKLSYLWKKVHSFLRLRGNSKLLRLIFKVINIKKIVLNINVHNYNNSAATGVITGCYWGMTGILLSFLSHKFNLSKADIIIEITPLFSKDDELSETFFNSIFNIRVGHIIIISIIVVFFMFYNKLCFPIMKRSGRFGKSSNRGIN